MTGFDVEACFARGGKPLLDYLTFCVFAQRLESVFAFLVREYRVHPTVPLALSLYDTFCAPGAPAHLSAFPDLLPPRNAMLRREVEWLRESRVELEKWFALPREEGDETSRPPPTPPVRVYMFDFLIAHMRALPVNPITAPGVSYDPSLAPEDNLPGGRLTLRQKRFLDEVWRPGVRPALVKAGFWKITTVGG